MGNNFDGLIFSERIRLKLDEDKAKEFTRKVIEIVYKAHEKVIRDLPFATKFHSYLAVTAIQSAYLDVYHTAELHEMEDDAPSAEKKGAAVTCWINRFRPLQLVEQTTDYRCAFVNSTVALMSGLELIWSEKQKIGTPDEVLADTNRLNNLMYLLLWRNPSYKILSTMFELL